MMRPFSQKGFTLTEIIITVLLFGIAIGFFNSVFMSNWFAYEERIKRANLWTEANQYFEAMSVEGRNSRLIVVTNTGNAKTVSFTNAKDDSVATFSIDNNGTLSRTKNSNLKIYGTHADFANSQFVLTSTYNLIANLSLIDKIYTRDIHITPSTEINRRNL